VLPSVVTYYRILLKIRTVKVVPPLGPTTGTDTESVWRAFADQTVWRA